MRLGIFGGTFDPPHVGHLILASEALNCLDLDQVLWVLTDKPPHKDGQQITALQDRLDMVRAAIAENPDFELSRIDIDRPPPYYAVETVQILLKQNPEARLIYLMGGDSLQNLLSWYQPQEFVGICHAIGVMRRPEDRVDLNMLKSQIPGIAQKIRFVNSPLIDISASDIRERVCEGRPFRYFVPDQVYKLIEERKLYRK